MMEKPISGAMATRQALVSTALKLFGQHGYDAVSTRQIADHAAANIGSIAYHYNGKPGLRIACAEYVIEATMESFGPEFIRPLPAGLGPDTAVDMLVDMLATFVRHVTQRPDAEEVSAFVMREMVQPGEVVDHMYTDMIRPFHQRLCELYSIATGRAADSEGMYLAVFTMMGQSMYFRMCKTVVLKRMGWDKLGPAEADAIIKILAVNLRALIAYYRSSACDEPAVPMVAAEQA